MIIGQSFQRQFFLRKRIKNQSLATCANSAFAIIEKRRRLTIMIRVKMRQDKRSNGRNALMFEVFKESIRRDTVHNDGFPLFWQ